MKRQMRMLAGAAMGAALLAAGVAGAGTLDPLSVHFLQGSDTLTDADRAPVRDIRVDVWTDFDEDEVLRRGEDFTLNFQTNADLYVVVYKMDVEGRVEILWPSSRYSDGFVYGNHTYPIPRPGQGPRLTVGNLKGVEYVEAIASSYPFDLRALGIDFRFDPDDRGGHDYYVDGDPFLAVNDINYAITGLDEDVDYVVTDWLHVYVEDQVDYARYSCNQCHMDDSGHPTVTAYVDTCTQVEVRVDWGWHRGWYVNFGWYPLYYEPPFYYWDYQWSRPYWYAWYPVPYRWPSYTCYTRPYPVWWWRSSGYWTGDYTQRWSNRRTRSVPLYDVGRVSSRTRSVAGRDGTRRTIIERPVSARGSGAHDGRRVDRDTLVRNSRPPGRVDRPTGAGAPSRRGPGEIRDPGRRDSGRGGIRTDRSDRERITSKSPPGGRGTGRAIDRTPDRGRGDTGRRWTRPEVQNDRAPSRPSVRDSRDRRGSGRDKALPRGSSTDRRGSSRDRKGSSVDRTPTNRSRDSRPPAQKPKVDRNRSGSSGGGRGKVQAPRSQPRPQPKPKVDRSRSGSSGGGRGKVQAPRSQPRPQPKPKPAPRSRGGSGGSRSRGGGGRG